MMRIIFSLMLVWTALAVPQPVAAQALYKCAGVYQDRPCDSAIQSQFSNLTGDFSKEKANPRADARCAQAGGIVQKAREQLDAGKTVEAVSAEITKNNNDKLLHKPVKDVVRDISEMKGTPLQVRYKFEGDCTDQRAMLLHSGRSSGYRASASASAAEAARAAAQEARIAAHEARMAARNARSYP